MHVCVCVCFCVCLRALWEEREGNGGKEEKVHGFVGLLSCFSLGRVFCPEAFMTFTDQCILRRAFSTVTASNAFPKTVPENVSEALSVLSNKLIAYELFSSVVYSFENRKILKTVATRYGGIFIALRTRYYTHTNLNVYFAKMNSILSEVCYNLIEYLDEEFAASVCLEVVHGILKVVSLDTAKLPPANYIFRLLSCVTIPPENFGQKRYSGMAGKHYVHQLANIAICTNELDLHDVNASFLKSPSLKALFVNNFTAIAKQGNLEYHYMNMVSTYLEIPIKLNVTLEAPPLPPSVVDNAQDEDVSSALGNFFQRVLSDEDLDTLLSDDPMARTTPEHTNQVANPFWQAVPRLHCYNDTFPHLPKADAKTTMKTTATKTTTAMTTPDKKEKTLRVKSSTPNPTISKAQPKCKVNLFQKQQCDVLSKFKSVLPIRAPSNSLKMHFRIQKNRIVSARSVVKAVAVETPSKQPPLDESELLCYEEIM